MIQPESKTPSSDSDTSGPLPVPARSPRSRSSPNNYQDHINIDSHPNPAHPPNLTPHQLSPPSRLIHEPASKYAPEEEYLQHWSSTNIKKARFHTSCPACHEEISTGDKIAYQFQYRRFVHLTCATAPRTGRHYAPPPHPNPPQAAAPPAQDPLAPGSPLDSLAPEYRAEAVRWVQYHEGYPRIPGIHEGFSARTLEHYLRYRSETCRNLAGICCKLKKMGEACGFVLCTSKYQQPSLQYQQLRTINQKLNKARRLKGRDAETNQALAAGNLGVTMVLSGFDTKSARRMRPLDPLVREFLAMKVMMHGGCIRFGLFRNTDILREHLEFSTIDNCPLLRSTWRKTRKSNRPYSIKFECRPAADNPARYAIPGARGPTYTSAGQIITWYLQASNLMNAPGKALLFPNFAQISDKRGVFTRWLQSVYRALLPAGSVIPDRIRPHSMRAGWATDRARQNTNPQTIMLEGRWNDQRAMNTYVRTALRDLVTSMRHRPIPDEMKTKPFGRRQ